MSSQQPNHTPYSTAGEPRYPAATQRGGSRKQVERTLDVLYRRRWIVIACFVAAGLFTVYQALTSTDVYETSAVVLLDVQRMPGGGQTEEVVGNTPFIRSERNLSTEIFILQNSHAIAQRVNERMRQLQNEGADVSWPVRGGVRFEPASRGIASAITVRANSPNPEEAAILANVYAEEYVRQTQDASRQYLAATRSFLEEQEARRSSELESAENAYQEYQQRAGALALTREGTAIVGRSVGLEAQRDEAMIELQMRQASLESIERELAEISPQLASRMSSDVERRLNVLTEELGRLETDRRNNQAYASERGASESSAADLQRIERRMNQVQSEINQLTERYVDEVMAVGGIDGSTGAVSYAADLRRRSVQERIALEGLRARIGSMNDRLGQYRSEMSAIPELSTDMARLERDRMLAEQMYQYVVQRLQDTRIQEESEPGYARVLRQAAVPSVPVGPDQWRSVGVGLLIGLLLGIGLAIFRDRFDTRIYKPDQLREQGRPVVGVIPNLAAHIKEFHNGDEAVEREGEDISTSLVTLLEPLSAPSEAFRHVRTTLQFSRPDKVLNTVLVTSAAQGDGKTTAAANVAITMAQSHRRTLLIDADLRRPRVHSVFGTEGNKGLVELLASDGPSSVEALERVLRRYQSPQHPNLSVLPAGDFEAVLGAEVNPAELLGSRRMRDLLQRLQELYDVVVIDTPPVLAATDAVLLSTQADSVLVVVRAATTKEGDLEHTLEMLDDVGAPVSGMLLNGFDLSMAYGYRYSYGHYTKFGPYSRHAYAKTSKTVDKSEA